MASSDATKEKTNKNKKWKRSKVNWQGIRERVTVSLSNLSITFSRTNLDYRNTI